MNTFLSRRIVTTLVLFTLFLTPTISYAQEEPSTEAGAGIVLAILALVLVVVGVVAVIGAVGLGVIGIGYGMSQGDDE